MQVAQLPGGRTVLGSALVVGAGLALSAIAHSGRTRLTAGHVRQRRCADPPAEMPGVSPARLDRADVAAYLRGDAAVGQVHPGARDHAPDAAVAHRQDGRRSALQERHVAVGPADRHHRPLGRSGRAARRSEGYAAGQAGRDRQRVGGRQRRHWASRTSSSSPTRIRCPRIIRMSGGGRRPISA